MTALFWHRRDLRIDDNKGLFDALKQNEIVHPIFIFDKSILDKLPNNDQRILFIYQEIESLKKLRPIYDDHGIPVGDGQEIDFSREIKFKKSDKLDCGEIEESICNIF